MLSLPPHPNNKWAYHREVDKYQLCLYVAQLGNVFKGPETVSSVSFSLDCYVETQEENLGIAWALESEYSRLKP